MAFVQSTALRHGGRPHWGQYNKLVEQQVRSLYQERFTNWRESLYRVSLASTIFSNGFTRQRGLEPLKGTSRVPTPDVAYLVPLLLCDPASAAATPSETSYLAPLLLFG